MKKLCSKLLAAFIAMVSCLTIIPETAVGASAEEMDCMLPLPDDKSYGITVFDRYSDGSSHSSYITEWVLHEGGASQPYCVMDIAAAKNTPVYAVADGRVEQNNSVKKHNNGGNNVVLSHSDGSYSYYGHLISQSKLKKGAEIKKGDLIGYVGKTGAATGYHLHFEWSGHDPYCEFKEMGYDLYISKNSGAAKYSHDHDVSTQTMYVINTDGELNINQTPSTKKRIGSMPEGAECTVYPSRNVGNWYYVEYNGLKGYAYAKYLTSAKSGETYQGRITGTDCYLMINSKPKAGYAIGSVPEGECCTVYVGKNHGNWQWVSYNGIFGYAYGKYIVNAGETSYSQDNEIAAETMYVVNTTGGLNINQTPSTKQRISWMPTGAECTVYPSETSGNWYYVEYNGVKGYAYGKYLSSTKPEDNTYQGRISGTDCYLMINSKPKAGYGIGYIPEGEYCTVYIGKNHGNWQWVSYNGVSGYAYGKYIVK